MRGQKLAPRRRVGGYALIPGTFKMGPHVLLTHQLGVFLPQSPELNELG